MLQRFYDRLIGEHTSFGEVAHESKRVAMEGTLASGLTLLVHSLKRLADSAWTTRDITLNSLKATLVEFIASLSVYRTYAEDGSARADDAAAVELALQRALRRHRGMDPRRSTSSDRCSSHRQPIPCTIANVSPP